MKGATSKKKGRGGGAGRGARSQTFLESYIKSGQGSASTANSGGMAAADPSARAGRGGAARTRIISDNEPTADELIARVLKQAPDG